MGMVGLVRSGALRATKLCAAVQVAVARLLACIPCGSAAAPLAACLLLQSRVINTCGR